MEQIRRFEPKIACVTSLGNTDLLKQAAAKNRTKVVTGLDGLIEIATHPDVDMVVFAIVGSISLIPLLKAIEAKKEIALASKEALVSAGEIVMKEAKANGVKIIPVDSEHSAIFQCLNENGAKFLNKIYLTGSGGPLRKLPKSAFGALRPDTVIKHPRWNMGKKISVDSATLMNKGLEVIEAMRLFSVSVDDIQILIHPEAVIHSMVEFVDGSVLAQLSVADMKLPIQYALTWPGRLGTASSFRLDFDKLKSLTFSRPDLKKFPCLQLAIDSARDGGTYPAALNASNEEAVFKYLDGKIKFTRIPTIVEKVLSIHKGIHNPKLRDILETDNWAREEARTLCYQ